MAAFSPGFVSAGAIDDTLGQDEEDQQRAEFEAYQRWVASQSPPEQPPQDFYGPPQPDYSQQDEQPYGPPSPYYGSPAPEQQQPQQPDPNAWMQEGVGQLSPYEDTGFDPSQLQPDYGSSFGGLPGKAIHGLSQLPIFGQQSGLGIGLPAGNQPSQDPFGLQQAYDTANVDIPYYSDFIRNDVRPAAEAGINAPFNLAGIDTQAPGQILSGFIPAGAADVATAALPFADQGMEAAQGLRNGIIDRWPQPVYHVPRDLETAASINQTGLRSGTAVSRDRGFAQDLANRWSQTSGEQLPVMEFRAAPRDLTQAGWYSTNNNTLFPQTGETGSGPNPLGFTGKGTRAELRAALESQGIDTAGMKPGEMESAWRESQQVEPPVTDMNANQQMLEDMGHPPLPEGEQVPVPKPEWQANQPEPEAAAGGVGGMEPPIKPPVPPNGEMPPNGDPQEWLRTNRERARDNAANGATSPAPPKSIKDLTNVAEESRYNKGLGVGGEAEPPTPSPLKRAFDELMNLPGIAQTVMAGGDVSAIGRQEAVLGAGNPARWKEAAAATLKAFKSPEAADAANEAIHGGKWYDFQKTAGVHEYEFGPGVNPAERVPGYTGISDSWLGRQMTKEWRIGGHQVPNPLLAGERSFATGLNVEGFGVGEDYLQKMWDIAHANPKGFNNAVFERDARALAKVINHGRGYGTGRVADVMSATHAFFSGRNLVSKVQIVLDPFFQPGSVFEPSARQLAAKNLIGFASANAGLMTFLGLTGAAAGGLWSVNPDPLAGDFGKLRIGNMRIDTMGGVEPLIRLVAREGVAIRQGDWAKVTPELTRFFANKGSPAVSVLRDAMVAADPGLRRYLGSSDSFSGKAFALRFAPLMLQDMLEAYEQQGGGPLGFGSAALAGASDFVGLGVNTYQDAAQPLQSTFDPRFANPSTPSKARGVIESAAPTATPARRARY